MSPGGFSVAGLKIFAAAASGRARPRWGGAAAKSLKFMQAAPAPALAVERAPVSFTFHYGIICHGPRIPYHSAIVNNQA